MVIQHSTTQHGDVGKRKKLPTRQKSVKGGEKIKKKNISLERNKMVINCKGESGKRKGKKAQKTSNARLF